MSETGVITNHADSDGSLRSLPQYQLVKAEAHGRTVTRSLIQEHRNATKLHIAGLRAQMLETQARLANLILSGSKKDLDCVARLRAEIAIAEDADSALELAEVLAELRDIEAAQKQRSIERERLAKEQDKVHAAYDLEDRPSYTVERHERLLALKSQIHGIATQIANVDHQIESDRQQSVELESRLGSFAG